jgi:hypothetical protein
MTTKTTETREGKIYSLKSSAQRAAKQDGLEKGQFVIMSHAVENISDPTAKSVEHFWYVRNENANQTFATLSDLGQDVVVTSEQLTAKAEEKHFCEVPEEMLRTTLDQFGSPEVTAAVLENNVFTTDEDDLLDLCAEIDAEAPESQEPAYVNGIANEAMAKRETEELRAINEDAVMEKAAERILGAFTDLPVPEPKKVGAARVYPTEKVVTSTCASPTKRVWEIADTMTGAAEVPARRRDVVLAALAEGIATNTAKTQYQWWKKAREESRAAAQNAAVLK